MKNRITTGYKEIRESVHLTTNLPCLVNYIDYLIKWHLNQFIMSLRENIAVFASLVTTIGDMELKCKVVHVAMWSLYFEPQEAVTLFPQEEATLLPQDEATLLPQEEETLLPQEEATLLPQDDATLFPQEEATLLPHDEANDEPAIPFITPCAVDGDV